MDGNFKAEHQKLKNPADDVVLSNGGSFFVAEERFKAHLRESGESREVNITFNL
jgi:hypothetical protein